MKLVDKFVDDVPKPLVGQFSVDRSVVVKNEVEQIAVVVVGLVSVLEGGRVSNAGVNVPEVQLLVQDEKERVVRACPGKMRRKGGQREKMGEEESRGERRRERERVRDERQGGREIDR